MVYETRAITPNPAPRTWVQKYSEYRQGVPEYVELPIASPVVAASSRMAFDSTPVIVDHHEFLPLEDEPDDAKGYSGYE
jgi:hypothetical protein